MAHDITDAEFEAEVLKSPIPVLVDFWAPWCGPCRSMSPILEELEKEYEGKVKIVKINVDENTEVPAQHNVSSIPTFVLFKDGKVANQFVGAKTKQDMKSELDAVAS